MKTVIHTASDMGVDLGRPGRLCEKSHIEQLMAYLASLGSKQHEVVFDICKLQAFQREYDVLDLFRFAVQTAHKNGMKFHFAPKIQEALPQAYMPHTLAPADRPVWNDLCGSNLSVDPFAIAHPEFCYERMPDEWDRPGPVAGVRLVKGDNAPSAIEAEHLSVWTTDKLGNGWVKLDQPFTVEESLEWRPLFPKAKQCRILTLTGLKIPEDRRYIEVRLSDVCPETDFTTPSESLMELVGEDGRTLPATTCEAQVALRRGQAGKPEWENMRHVGLPARTEVLRAFHQEKRAAIARGKNGRLPILSPVYPEVRKHWMDMVKTCLDLGADGVNIRPSTHYHFRCNEPWSYGYNQPAVETAGGALNTAAVARANGDALTQFLGEAGEVVHSRGKQLGVHVLANNFRVRDDSGKILGYVLMDWQWEKWISDIVDYAEFRGMMGLTEPAARHIADQVALACRDAGKPFILQCDRRVVHFEGPLFAWEGEMGWAMSHPDISAYQLYETGYFTRLDESGKLLWNPAVEEIIGRSRQKAGA